MFRYAIRDGNSLAGRANAHRLAIRSEDGHRHHPVIERDIKKFLAIAAPAGQSAAGGRHGRDTSRAWKRLGVDLVRPSRFELYATHFPSGENCPPRSVKTVLTIGIGRRSPGLVIGNAHKSAPRLGIDPDIQQKPAIPRPVLGGHQWPWRREQERVDPSTARRCFPDLQHAGLSMWS